MKKKSQRFGGWSVLIGCCIVMFLIQSCIQAFSVYMPAIASSTGWTVSNVALVSTTATVGAFFANMSISFFSRKIGPKYLVCLGIILYSIHAFLMSVSSNIYMLWFAGFVCGGAIAFGTIAPCSILITNWFIKNRSQFVAIVVAASMFGSTLINPLAGMLIEQFGWRNAYKIQSIVIGGLALLAAVLLLSDTPAKKHQTAYGASDTQEQGHPVVIEGITPAAARKSTCYWLMLVGIFLIGLSTNIENYLPAFWQSKGMNPVTSSGIMGVYAFISAICSIAMSKVNDKLGGKNFVMITSISFAVSTAIMILTNVVSFIPLLICACVPFAMGSKKASSLTPTLVVSEAFGSKHYNAIIGAFTAALQLGIAVSNPAIGTLMNYSGQNPYTLPFGVMIFINVIGMVLVFTALINKPFLPGRKQAM